MKVALEPEKSPVADVMWGRYSHTRGSTAFQFHVPINGQIYCPKDTRLCSIHRFYKLDLFNFGVHIKGHNDWSDGIKQQRVMDHTS